MRSGEASTTPRKRGRAGVKQRDRRLRSEPLCRKCSEKGVTRIADVVDHILPLSVGGTDTDDNCQSLCNDCHAIKTASEGIGGANHPDWLNPSAIPITIVTGPPCAGKTTYIQDKVLPNDTVIDLDGIMRQLLPGYQHWQGMLNKDLLDKAIRVRNAMLGALERKATGNAWFIVSAPTEAERKWWHGKLGGQLVLLHPGVDECKHRAIKRGTPNAVEGVDKWERSSRLPWIPPEKRKAKVLIGVDGWPIE